jgi:glycerol uptake facilitator-like aquaporin
LAFILIFAGLGLGALNEVNEFLVTLVLPINGVGGYMNVALDLVADFLGAIFAVLLLTLMRRRKVYKYEKLKI